jgi:hypothetical protein
MYEKIRFKTPYQQGKSKKNDTADPQTVIDPTAGAAKGEGLSGIQDRAGRIRFLMERLR